MAVKAAKRLMSKIKEVDADPLSALLGTRNTAEHSGLLPRQLMFGRGTPSRLPTTDKPPHIANVRGGLSSAASFEPTSGVIF